MVGAPIPLKRTEYVMRNFKLIISNLVYWIGRNSFVCGDDPFMPNFEKEAFIKIAGKANHILEFGSGGSTIWFLKNGKHVTCIENNRKWIKFFFEKVSSFDNINFIYADTGITGNYGVPLLANFDPSIVKKGLTYVLSGFRDPNQVRDYDLIFVDGRWRISCCLYAVIVDSSNTPILLDDFEDDRNYKMLDQFFNISLYGRLAYLTAKENIDRGALLKVFLSSLRYVE